MPAKHAKLTGDRGQAAMQAGFSLVELLVVMAIISILASLLLSAIPLVKGMTRKVQCASNLRQIGTAILVYAEDHGGNFPMHDRDNPTKWPYVFADWGFRRGYGGGSTFYDDYLPAGRKVYYCPEGLMHQLSAQQNDVNLSYPTFPSIPLPGQTDTVINYNYFAGTNEAGKNERGGDGTGSGGEGPRGTWNAKARSTLIADVMKFGAAPYINSTIPSIWNHWGSSSNTPPMFNERAGGHMFQFDGHVAWVSGSADLLKFRHAPYGNEAQGRSYVAEQRNDPR
jgi:prepilin-type N-terminal cleavage/methylation domain-containing protein